MDAVTRLLQGSIDLHIHPSPSLFPRRIDAVEAAQQAAQAGMRAIVIKSHHHTTAPELVPLKAHDLKDIPLQVFGGVETRKGPDYGEIFDHHAVEFEYADGSRVFEFD